MLILLIRSPNVAAVAGGAIVVFAGLLGGCSPGLQTSARQTVNVLAAASTCSVIDAIAERYRRDHPHVKLVVSYGPSSGLARQIQSGAPCDIFVSANARWTELLEQQQMARETARWASNKLVLVVPRGNPARVSGPEDLLRDEVRRVAVATEEVPAAVYARQALTGLGLNQQLEQSGKLARGSDVRSTLTYVELGEADAGIVYATDALASSRVEIVCQFDAALHDPIVYHLVLIGRSPNAEAVEFFQCLLGGHTRGVLARHGFGGLSETPNQR